MVGWRIQSQELTCQRPCGESPTPEKQHSGNLQFGFADHTDWRRMTSKADHVNKTRFETTRRKELASSCSFPSRWHCAKILGVHSELGRESAVIRPVGRGRSPSPDTGSKEES